MRLFELAEDLKIKGSTKKLKDFLNKHGFGVKDDNDEVPRRGAELAMQVLPPVLAAEAAARKEKEKARHQRDSQKRAQKRKEEAEKRKRLQAEEKQRTADEEQRAQEETKRLAQEAKRKAQEEKDAAKQRAKEKKKRAAEEKTQAADEKMAAAAARQEATAHATPPEAEREAGALAAADPAALAPSAAPPPAVAAPETPVACAPPPPRPVPPPVGVSRDAYQARATVRPPVLPPRASASSSSPAAMPATPTRTPAAASKTKLPPPPPPPLPPVVKERKDAVAEKSGKAPAPSVETVPLDRLKKNLTLADGLKMSIEQAQTQTLAKRSRDDKEKDNEEERQKRKKPQFTGVENRDELINRPRLSASAALRQVLAERVAPVNVPGLRKLRKMRHSSPGSKPSLPPSLSAANAGPREIVISLPITVRDFSQATGIKVGEVIAKLMRMNIMANINQTLDRDTIEMFAVENNLPIKFDEPQETLEAEAFGEEEVQKGEVQLVRRNPVVTFMGHVDHGKTSLLDAIRQTNVAAGESGGITQHIGASQVTVPAGTITFIDTPGHEAFTSMRARGAKVTDIAVLVVAADDGLMPQSLEAIDHARAANVPIMVAINKIDLPGANPDRVLAQLAERGLTPEAWGGETICCNVSALTREGIDKLLEMICLQAEIMELRARPDGPASGVVLEAVLDPQRGPLVTLLVQQGRLQRGDAIVSGTSFARARTLLNYRQEPIESAGPSDPVLVLGFDSVPPAGSEFRVAKSERHARELVEERREAERLKRHAEAQKVSLETFYRRMANEKVKELRLIIKGDTQGTTEAVRAALERLSSGDAKVTVLHSGAGVVTDNDVILASASDAVVLAFRVDVQDTARTLAKSEGVDIKSYDVIYHATDEIQRALQGLLEPVCKEVETGVAEVRAIFKLSAGTVAGCHVISGVVQRSNRVRVLRAGQQVFEGEIQSLRHVKDEVREVRAGYDCGILLRGFSEVQEGDRIHSFKLERESIPSA